MGGASPYASECPVKARGAFLGGQMNELLTLCLCPTPPQVADTRFLVAMSLMSFSPRPLSRRSRARQKKCRQFLVRIARSQILTPAAAPKGTPRAAPFHGYITPRQKHAGENWF